MELLELFEVLKILLNRIIHELWQITIIIYDFIIYFFALIVYFIFFVFRFIFYGIKTCYKKVFNSYENENDDDKEKKIFFLMKML